MAHLRCVGIRIINDYSIHSLDISQEVAHLPEGSSCVDKVRNEPCENLMAVMFPEAQDCLAELDDDLFPFPKSDSEHEYSEFVSPRKLHHLKRKGRNHVDNVCFTSLIKIRNSLSF